MWCRVWTVPWLLGLSLLLSGCVGRAPAPAPPPAAQPPLPDSDTTVVRWQTVPDVERLFSARMSQGGVLADSAAVDPLLPSALSPTTSPAGRRDDAATHATRWADRHDDPIRVWIQDAPTLAGWRPANRTAVEEAFRAWEGVGVPIRFVFLESAPGADIVVRWIGQLAARYDGWTTTWQDRAGWITRGEMTLAVRTPEGKPLGLAALQAIATHEAGHTLGLTHASDTVALMAATVRTRRLAASDTGALRRLYDRASRL